MENPGENILVLGIGNDILTDDGIGPKLCDFLKDYFKETAVHFEKLNLGGLEILEFIQGFETVIFIDAIKTKGGKIGNVYLFTPNNFKETLHLSNLHDINFITALELGRKTGLKIPEKMYIIAIEIKEDMAFSEYFTEELALEYKNVEGEILSIFKELIPIKELKPIKN
jgi:hydrogenase maturation protease